MFAVATGDALWRMWSKYPELFDDEMVKSSLKPAGHAFALDYVEKNKPLRILEIGHGGNPSSLHVMSQTAECWGIDGDDVDQTVAKENLEALRAAMPGVTFREGYIGNSADVLPADYFDLVFSISVIEHIPEDQLNDFHSDIARILRPNGVQIHSYDVPWGKDVSPMVKAVQATGFEWIEPRDKWVVPWIKDYTPTDISMTKLVALTVFEHPRMVLDIFNRNVPREKRRLWNWTTILMGARKGASPTAP